MIKPATGDLAALPASREELEALNQVLHERLRDAETELHRWRAWGDAMPEGALSAVLGMAKRNGLKPDHIYEWMLQRPEPDTPKPATSV